MNPPPADQNMMNPLEKIQMEVEQMQQQSQLFSGYLAGLAHDIRTPLNSIIGFSGLLREKGVNVEDQEIYSRMIMRSSRRLLALLSNLIDLAKIENGSIRYFPEKISLTDLFEELEDEMNTERQIFEKDAVTLRIHPPVNRVSELVTDRNRLYQILKILLDNSLKFTDRGEIELAVAYKEREKFLFRVKDEGCGMDATTLAKLFYLFPGNDSEDKIKSRGLGILVARHLSEGIQGTLSFTSQPGSGTEAVLKLPEMHL